MMKDGVMMRVKLNSKRSKFLFCSLFSLLGDGCSWSKGGKKESKKRRKAGEKK